MGAEQLGSFSQDLLRDLITLEDLYLMRAHVLLIDWDGC